LVIDPCIPKQWDSFKVRRVFRDSVYSIEVSNPRHVSSGVRSIEVDEKKIQGNVLKTPAGKREHAVKVILG
jgi:cellobiose phosphorylase